MNKLDLFYLMEKQKKIKELKNINIKIDNIVKGIMITKIIFIFKL